VQFLDTMNDIKIIRYNRQGEFQKYVNVPLKFGPKEKIWYWINERKDDKYLPIMNCMMTSLEYDEMRQVNKVYKVTKTLSPSGGTIDRFINPVPYNIGFSLEIWALHMVDIDQIIEQILPYFTPEIYVKLKISELDIDQDIKVVFTGAIPQTTPEISDEEHRVVRWGLDFMMHGYLFQPVKDQKLIKKIIRNYYTNDTSWDGRSNSSTFNDRVVSGASETVLIEAVEPYYDEDSEKLYRYEIFE